MVKLFLKIFREFMMTISKKESSRWVHASVCLLVGTALDKMLHLWHRCLMKELKAR